MPVTKIDRGDDRVAPIRERHDDIVAEKGRGDTGDFERRQNELLPLDLENRIEPRQRQFHAPQRDKRRNDAQGTRFNLVVLE